MKLNYYPDTDSLYINFSSEDSTESEEIRDGIVLDFDKNGNVSGIDIQHASKNLDLSFLEMTAIPIQKTRLVS